jgi:hypothetical protein
MLLQQTSSVTSNQMHANPLSTAYKTTRAHARKMSVLQALVARSFGGSFRRFFLGPGLGLLILRQIFLGQLTRNVEHFAQLRGTLALDQNANRQAGQVQKGFANTFIKRFVSES